MLVTPGRLGLLEMDHVSAFCKLAHTIAQIAGQVTARAPCSPGNGSYAVCRCRDVDQLYRNVGRYFAFEVLPRGDHADDDAVCHQTPDQAQCAATRRSALGKRRRGEDDESFHVCPAPAPPQDCRRTVRPARNRCERAITVEI